MTAKLKALPAETTLAGINPQTEPLTYFGILLECVLHNTYLFHSATGDKSDLTRFNGMETPRGGKRDKEQER